jgi:recombination protein RecT
MATATAEKKTQAASDNQKALAKRDPKTEKIKQLATLIESRKAAFTLVAGAHFKPERLVKLAQGALARTPAIARCTPASILVTLMRCAELDLEPDSAIPQRRMWLVPRWNKKLKAEELTYIVDYRAQIQLARDSGLVKSVMASEVRKNDRFVLHYDAEGTSITKFEFEPGGANGGSFAPRGEVIGYFAAARLDGGEVQVAPLSKIDVEAFRDLRAPKSGGETVGPWKSDFDAMAIKTCLRKLWNLLPAGKSEAARKIQETAQTEDAIDHGRSVQSTAPVELDLGLPAEEEETTEQAVERALTAGGGGEPPDDVPFETAAEEEKRKAAELAQKIAQGQAPAREPGSDDGDDEFAR